MMEGHEYCILLDHHTPDVCITSLLDMPRFGSSRYNIHQYNLAGY